MREIEKDKKVNWYVIGRIAPCETLYTEVISFFSVITTNLVLKISLVAFVEFQIERQFRNLECQGKKVIIFVFQAFSWSNYRLEFKIAE